MKKVSRQTSVRPKATRSQLKSGVRPRRVLPHQAGKPHEKRKFSNSSTKVSSLWGKGATSLLHLTLLLLPSFLLSFSLLHLPLLLIPSFLLSFFLYFLPPTFPHPLLPLFLCLTLSLQPYNRINTETEQASRHASTGNNDL